MDITITELMALFLVMFSLITWPIIFIGKWLSRIRGKCPQTMACFNTKCKWRSWCKRFETIAYNIEHVKQMLEEAEKKEKSKENL